MNSEVNTEEINARFALKRLGQLAGHVYQIYQDAQVYLPKGGDTLPGVGREMIFMDVSVTLYAIRLMAKSLGQDLQSGRGK